MTVKPSCVNQLAILNINRYLQPRSIHVITSSERKCYVIREWASNIRCHLQDDFVPGVTLDAVAGYITKHFGVPGDSLHSGRTLAGWYLQQVSVRPEANCYVPWR